VAAVNWQARQILLGECKWGQQAVNRQVVRELVERKTLRLMRDLPDEGKEWQIHYAIFSRAGFTKAAEEELTEHNGVAVKLSVLSRELA
jgi:hypothetical protein